MKREYHNGRITSLEPNECFVFGSNEAGVHGAGAAKQAYKHFGAEIGIGVGYTGQCYAFPTKNAAIHPLSLEAIKDYAARFIKEANARPQLRFLLTAVGCGLGGKTPQEIAPLFEGAPSNVIFPPEFKDVCTPPNDPR